MKKFGEVMRETREVMKASHRCSICSRDTPYDQMATFGARCKACYDDYCQAGIPSIGFVGNGRPDTIAQAEMPGPHSNAMGGT